MWQCIYPILNPNATKRINESIQKQSDTLYQKIDVQSDPALFKEIYFESGSPNNNLSAKCFFSANHWFLVFVLRDVFFLEHLRSSNGYGVHWLGRQSNGGL